MAIGNDEGVARWASGSVRWNRTVAEEAAEIEREDMDLRWTIGNILRYGADRTGLYSSTTAVQAAHNVATVAQSLNGNNFLTNWIPSIRYETVRVPQGTYMLDGFVNAQNRVRMVGDGVLSSIIFASENYSNSVMFNYDQGTTPLFGCRFERLRLHASNRSSINRVIGAQSWQEHCGLFDMDISGYQSGARGILITDTSSGAAGFNIERTTFGGFSGNTAAIEVDSTVPNAFVLGLTTVTINPSGVATNGILMENGILNAANLHVENATHAARFEGASDARIDTMTGSGTVVNMITLDAAHTGVLRGSIIDPNGATGNTINDEGGADTTGFVAELAVN